MRFLQRLFGRSTSAGSDSRRPEPDQPSTASSAPTRLATKGSSLEHDLWLFLGRHVKKIIPSGSTLPAKVTILLTNDLDRPQQLVVLVLSGPSGQAPPKSLLLPTVLIKPLRTDSRLEITIRLNIVISIAGDLSFHAEDLRTDQQLSVTTSPPPSQSDAPWEIDGLRPNCLEWEEWIICYCPNRTGAANLV